MQLKEVLFSVLRNKCPHCREGSFFIYNNPYNFSKFDKMYPQCPKCGMDFRQEPGFYFGAAIMSYVLQVLVVFSTYPLFMLALDFSTEKFIIIIAVLLILLAPLTYRTARILWINILGKRPKD